MRVIDWKGPVFALALLSACRSEPQPSVAPSASASAATPAPSAVALAEPRAPRPQTLRLPGKREVVGLAFSDDGTRVAASFASFGVDAWRGEVAAWSVERGELLLHVVLPGGFFSPDALGFARDGGLLVGEGRWGSIVSHSYVRVSLRGEVGAVCEASPPSIDRRPGPQPRGVGDIVELGDGRVVTGGQDDSIAVWSATGCQSTWPRGTACGWAESVVHVARDSESSGFLTLGETGWRGEEREPPPLGLQRWRGPPWKREGVKLGAAAPPSRVEKDWLLSPNGQIIPRPSTDGGAWASAVAVAPDGSCAGVAADQTVWIEDAPGRRRRRIDLPGKTARLAVAPRCAAIAVEIEHAVWLCRERACIPP